MDDIFLDIHRKMPRQGPGNNSLTLRALQLAGNIPPAPQVLDAGCGPGMQTLCLADALPDSHIYAIDNHRTYLDELNQQITLRKLGNRIRTLEASFVSPPFDKESFDIIWSEGAIYIMGFENGLREWRRCLKANGIIAVSEISWLLHQRPAEINDYWAAQYPGMKHLTENLALAEECGYTPCGMFVFPPEAWFEHYYNPLLQRLGDLRPHYTGIADFDTVCAMEHTEIEMFRKYQSFYSYVFYVMRKR